MQLLSLLEQENFNLFEYWSKWFNSRRDKLDCHVLIRRDQVNAASYGKFCWLTAEITFMGDEFLPYEDQANLLFKVFAKEFIKLSESGQKQFISPMCGVVSFTEQKYVKDAVENTKEAIENVKLIIEEERFSFFGNMGNDPSKYKVSILVEDMS